ncbi:MAG: TetR/AcrR family transcriptional regulator [Actinomycetota bacterium]
MPKLWTETIEAHRREVRDAILDTTAGLVAEYGLLAVTMSQIAERTSIGRATLYKYFPDVQAILLAWHERAISGHLEHLAEVRDRADGAGRRLEAVLEAYALIDHEHHGSEHAGRHLKDPALEAALHRGGHVARAQGELWAMIRDLIAAAERAGEVRGDVSPAELASYCIHALAAASSLPSKAAVRRLVGVTLSGVRAQG